MSTAACTCGHDEHAHDCGTGFCYRCRDSKPMLSQRVAWDRSVRLAPDRWAGVPGECSRFVLHSPAPRAMQPSELSDTEAEEQLAGNRAEWADQERRKP